MSEKVVADRGDKGDRKVCHPDKLNNELHKRAMNNVWARRETINGRLKTWKSMKQVFRHCRTMHHIVFRSCLVLEQIKMQNGTTSFQVTNYEDPIVAWE